MYPIHKLPPGSPDSPVLTHSRQAADETLSLSKGDVFRAQVVRKLSSHEILIETGRGMLSAQSNHSFNRGDSMLLKVEELQPQILLSLVQSSEEAFHPAKSNLAMFRSSPDSLFNVIRNGLALCDGDLHSLLPFLEKAEADSLQRMLSSLVYSEKSLNDPLFIKQFIINLGFLVEKSLRRFSSGYTEKEDDLRNSSAKTLKDLLSRLSVRMRPLLSGATGSELNPGLLKALENLVTYADDALEAIYNHQVINVIGQEEEQGYYFQIPVKSSEHLTMADLFVDLKGQKSKNLPDRFRFVVFVTMDALGDLMVDVNCRQKKVWGTFKCSHVDSDRFLQKSLEILNDRMTSAGYSQANFTVCRCSHLAEEKLDFINNRVIYSKKIINCFA
ncbi:MAG: hypothetical protein A4E70_00367 [Syntrophus sp. PtaU1.Bin005]|jgi:hypothetical protein|nr:MAG: hypothetical protein A4E70_00367 [Syntrophus sp. PtaU1.Bin005]